MNNTLLENKKFEEVIKIIPQATETEIHKCPDKAKFIWIPTKNIIRSIAIKTPKGENIKRREKIKILEKSLQDPGNIKHQLREQLESLEKEKM